MLRKLLKLAKSAQKKSPQPARLPIGVRGAILNSLGLKTIPAMPKAAEAAFRIATNPAAEAHDFIGLLESDEGLSARVLKIANSVFYDRGGGSKTIIEAVNVVGIAELRNLLNATALSGLFQIKHPLRADFWGHDVATAIVAKVLARNLAPDLSEQVFLAGLMHDIGKLLILQQHRESYEKLVKKGFSEGLESTLAEYRGYSFDHAQVGQLIAELWNFSPELYEAIGDHHKPWRDLKRGSLVTLVKLGNLIAHSQCLGIARDGASHQKIYSPLLDEGWSFFGVQAREQKGIVQQALLEFNAEFQNYEGWGR
jgi:putative nucleotidyltransferase with HDIG domain